MLDREILVVDDEKDLRTMIRSIFESAGYTQVTTVASGEDALALMAKKIPGIIILDVMMPDMDGFELLQEIRAVSKVPVLMLTAKGEAEDRFAGFELGADDYLVKPFAFDELLARIRAMTRKRAGNRKNQFSIADLTVDIERRTVFRGGKEITLIPKEFSLLECLVRNQGVVLSREQLENQIWNYEFSGSSNNIDVYISRLRKKIDSENQPRLLHTIRGVGWVLRADES